MNQPADKGVPKRLYIAGTGMITPVGMNAGMTAAAVKAGISGYAIAEGFYTAQGKDIKAAQVPHIIFDEMSVEFDEGDRFSPSHDRMIKMAILAIHEACVDAGVEEPIPLIIGLPEDNTDKTGLSSLTEAVEQNCQPWVSRSMTRTFHTGRAAGIEALQFAFDYLYDSPAKFMLIGGVDCLLNDERMERFGSRLLTEGAANAFAPGEGAGFLLLTRHPELALAQDGYCVAFRKPGIALEEGHLHSDAPYRGDGLASAFKAALNGVPEQSVGGIYSSMNGELYWAKEYGVAFIRNKQAFVEPIGVEHPADSYGDLGAATGGALSILAAQDLWRGNVAQSHLVYASSDTEKRGAVVLEKIAVANKNGEKS